MAYNVFGTPVTNSTLKSMPEYAGKAITRGDRAYVALNLKNAEDKDKHARQYLEKLKQQCGDGVSTLCLIYNATGNPITLVNNHDWHGRLGPSPLPKRIENGQWGVFLHGAIGSKASSSEAAVVYHDASVNCDFMVAWSNQGNEDSNNKAYTEIRDGGHYDKNDLWDYIYGLLRKSTLYRSDKRENHGCISTVSIGNGASSLFEAIFTVEEGRAAEGGHNMP